MLSKTFTIRCDGGRDFQDHYCTSSLNGPLKSSVKAKARAAGWGRKGWFMDEWICPKCRSAAAGFDEHAAQAMDAARGVTS